MEGVERLRKRDRRWRTGREERGQRLRGFGSPDRTLPKPPFSTPRRELRLSTAPAGSKSNYKSGLKKKKKEFRRWKHSRRRRREAKRGA